MLLQRPSSSANTRPAYLDNMYLPTLPSPSIRSANSGSSYNSASSIDLRISQPFPARSLSPSYEEDVPNTDLVRSRRPILSPRFQVRNIFNRRTFPQPKTITNTSSTTLPPTTSTTPNLPARAPVTLRRPSLPKLQTSFASPSRKNSSPKLLPSTPVRPAKEISCHRCYYYAARNCNGWVMDGSHGDSCEQCLQAGYFGAP